MAENQNPGPTGVRKEWVHKPRNPGLKTSKIKPNSPDTINAAEKMAEKIKAHHDKTDEDLLREIQVRPENADKKTHALDREQQEARLVLMHRLLIRKVSPQDIQKQLGITQEMYYYLRPKLDAMLRLDISRLDVPYMIGDTLALYDEVRAMALTMASSQQLKDPRTKVQALSVALKAESDKNNFLTQCGVYAPQIIEHLIRGMVSTGVTHALSGESKQKTKNVDDMVVDLLSELQRHSPVFGESDRS